MISCISSRRLSGSPPPPCKLEAVEAAVAVRWCCDDAVMVCCVIVGCRARARAHARARVCACDRLDRARDRARTLAGTLVLNGASARAS